MIVGVLLAGALKAVGSATSAQFQTARRSHAYLLAHALMSEIVTLSYREPGTSSGFGRGAGEWFSPTRAPYDDVDDYDQISDNPPVTKDGTALTNVSGWSRFVDVDYVRATDFTDDIWFEDGAKRIVVYVYYNGKLMATLTSVVTDA